MKIAYFDCFSGISGDMCLGALVGAGVSIKALEKELKKIPVKGYRLVIKKVRRAQFKVNKVDVIRNSGFKNQKSEFRKWTDIERVIQSSSLSNEIKQKGLKIFKRIFKAEAKVHGASFQKVHLHEIGAIDSIVDIFGTVIGLKILGIKEVYSSPLNLGNGSIDTEKGIFPIPAPATVEILKNVPVYSDGVPYELTTPTGAAIIRELSTGFGEIPHMKINNIGVGAGENDFKYRPNILRLFIGDKIESYEKCYERITIIEANIDDMNPQIYEYLIDKLLDAGALDVFLTQLIMKKGRPGIKITVLCDNRNREDLIRTILSETSTIGLRYHEVNRVAFERKIKIIQTNFGKMRVKISRLGDDIIKIKPEYEDCKKIAKRLGIPLLDVMKNVNIKQM